MINDYCLALEEEKNTFLERRYRSELNITLPNKYCKLKANTMYLQQQQLCDGAWW